MTNLIQSAPWQALMTEHERLSPTHLRDLFNQDPQRFSRFSLQAVGLFLDYSKNRITANTLEQLIALAHTAQLSENIEDLFTGKPINNTENRPALHTALRDPSDAPIWVNGIDIRPQIKQCLEQMQYWVAQLHSGTYRGYSNLAFTDVVHIGIGGSHLGPAMASQALYHYAGRIRCHFVSSVDATQLAEVLKPLNPETTLFIIASKTFTTAETKANADRAKAWLLAACGKLSSDLMRHFIATTANVSAALEYGIAPEAILPLWDWVGGRYSLWSAVGLPVAILIGMDRFQEMLAGAHAMDQHFRAERFSANLPVILGLLGFWYTTFFQAATHAVLPYDYTLRSLPRFLQQLDMESNGKRIQKNGTPVAWPTAPVLFGEMGTDGQHSFHQLLFQGTQLTPCDFIATLHHNPPEPQQPLLLANCFAQSRAMMWGKQIAEIVPELLQQGYDDQQALALAPHKTIPGNQPSNTLIITELTPFALGALLALYEHKTFVQGVLWHINSFDQWGVELGKDIARDIMQSLHNPSSASSLDASTAGLVAYTQKLSF